MNKEAEERLEQVKQLVAEGKYDVPEGVEGCFPITQQAGNNRKYEFVYVRPEFWGPHEHNNGGIVLKWGCKGIGFGEATLYLGKDNILKLDTEAMNDTFVDALFAELRKQIRIVE